MEYKSTAQNNSKREHERNSIRTIIIQRVMYVYVFVCTSYANAKLS